MIVERTVSGATLVAECASWNAAAAADVLAAFDTVEPTAGTMIVFGWSTLRLTEVGGRLTVCEPDYRRWPTERWVPTLDVTLDVLTAQVELLRRTGVDAAEAADVRADDDVLTVPGVLAVADVFVRRDPPAYPGGAEWSVGPTADPDALARATRLDPVPVGALVRLRPALLPLLVLPVGWIAVVEGDAVVHAYDHTGVDRL